MATVIPLSDASRRPTTFPFVTLTIIIVNVVVFIFELMNGESWVERWSLIPAHVSAGHDLITVFTAMFMHASWSHIIGNMVFLWAFGPEIEDGMGPLRYMIFYLLGGVVAMLGQVAVDPHSTVPNLGASGAIAAVMGSFMISFPADQIRSILVIFVFARVTYISAGLLIGIWFLTQLFSLGTVAQSQSGGVAYVAHVAGFIYGLIFGRLFGAVRRPQELY